MDNHCGQIIKTLQKGAQASVLIKPFINSAKKAKFGAKTGMLPKLKSTCAYREFMEGQKLAFNILFQVFKLFF